MATVLRPITDGLLEAFLQCKFKSRLRIQDRAGRISEFESHQIAQDKTYRLLADQRLLALHPGTHAVTAPLADAATLAVGKPLVLALTATGDSLQAHIDAIERIDKPSLLGDFSYQPIQYCREDTISRTARLLLAFRSIVLGEIQGVLPSYGLIIHGPDFTRRRLKLDSLQRKVRHLLVEIDSQMTTPGDTSLMLNAHCAICEFQGNCKDEAIRLDSLSLLRGISPQEIKSHNQKGIFTVNQLSYTFRHRKPSKRAKHPAKLHHFALQALSLRTNTVHVHGDPALPNARTTVYFDIEGLPEKDFYYLIGAVVVQDGKEIHHSFWAAHKAEQKEIFVQFMRLVAKLLPCQLFHYGRYDADALKTVQRGLDGETRAQVSVLLEASTNVHAIVHSHVYFPTHSNSLKDIASYLGFQWTESSASGIQSILWRDNWEISRDPSVKEMLMRYNREDCLALKTVCDFIQHAMTVHNAPDAQQSEGPAIVNTDELRKQRSKWVVYGRPTFVLKDLERASNCAHFDYQRDRVYARADKKIARTNRRRNKSSTASRPNKSIEITCTVCARCGSRDIRTQRRVHRRVIDLRFTKTGVKRWVTKYSSRGYRCLACGKTFLPEGWPKYRGYYGEALAIWCVYQNIACRQTMWQVNDVLSDLFAIRLSSRRAYLFKTQVIGHYDTLYDDLRKHILGSAVLCVDEGDVTIRSTKGYVWVFAAQDAVWYLYKDTRSGDFLQELMKGFSGVLISDFYSAYDSIECPQQKCLLHLLRDLNDDLQKHPFDEELKSIAQQFGVVLRSAVDTIDRRGLKTRYLHKHKRAADTLLADVGCGSFSSEVARGYQKRFKKHGPKLFTFLDYDGVSWNNNGAEYSVKYFMKYRKMGDGLFSERSLKEALVMLSIVQTCKLNGVNPLRFMLSKRTDLGSILG